MNLHQPPVHRIDPGDLGARYGEERLPRYTSYPTAPHFSPAISGQDYGRWLASIPEERTASLYLHVPFCRSMCWYCGCNTTVSRQDGPIADYVAALRREIEVVSGHIGRPLPVRHIHFGGGTPTIVTPRQFQDLMELLRKKFVLLADAEVAVEIDPRTLTAEMTRALGASGVNRASLGVQSFDPVVQKAINRVQTFDATAAAADGLREAGVQGVNFDLIYGLPHQTVTSCIDTVSRSVSLRPDRFSVFGYAHIPSFKAHQRKIDEAHLPDGPERHRQANAIARALTDAGYRQIGLDHFALPDDDLSTAQTAGTLHRNFQGYTTDESDILIAFGASAIGKLDQGYVQNDVMTRSYSAQVNDGRLATRKGYALTDDDRLRAAIIERLMCDFRADLGAIGRRHGASVEALLESAPRLRALAADGIVRWDGAVLSVAEETRYLVRSVASAFDAYLGTSGPVYSRAV